MFGWGGAYAPQSQDYGQVVLLGTKGTKIDNTLGTFKFTGQGFRCFDLILVV